MLVDANFVTAYAALISTVGFLICTVLLIGFRRGRLRTYNIYVVFSTALVAARVFAEAETGSFGGWWGAFVWMNLAVCAIWGVIGMLGIASHDASVYVRRPDVADTEPKPLAVVPPEAEPEDEVPVHDAKLLARIDVLGEQVSATGDAMDALTEGHKP